MDNIASRMKTHFPHFPSFPRSKGFDRLFEKVHEKFMCKFQRLYFNTFSIFNLHFNTHGGNGADLVHGGVFTIFIMKGLLDVFFLEIIYGLRHFRHGLDIHWLPWELTGTLYKLFTGVSRILAFWQNSENYQQDGCSNYSILTISYFPK